MTLRQVFEAALTELSKVNAPSLLLSEFNYYLNRAVNQYINKCYNIYDVTQQTSDNLRVLKSSAILTPQLAYQDLNKGDAESQLSSIVQSLTNLQGATYDATLPNDYLHLLNCICVFKVKKTWKCYDAGSYVQLPAKRLTADSWGQIITDFYNRPTPERPYFYIHNRNTSEGHRIPTNPINPDITDDLFPGTDMVGHYGYSEDDGGIVVNPNFAREVALSDGNSDTEDGSDSNAKISTVEREIAHRYGNASPVRIEIRYGKDYSVFELIGIQVDYIKAPQHLRLTQEQMDLTEDVSQIMEYPDFVCQEIINELVTILMARTGDPAISVHAQTSQSIASPVQQQAPTAAQSAQ